VRRHTKSDRAKPGRAILLFLALSTATADAQRRPLVQVLVVKSAGLPAYEEAMEGLRSILLATEYELTVLDLNRATGSADIASLLARKPAIIVAAGSASVEAVSAAEPGIPVVATMVLARAPGSASYEKTVGTITLDVPPAEILLRLKKLYPKRTRIALIRGPALSVAGAASLAEHARVQGYVVQVLDCAGPKALLDAFASLRNRVDFVWCLPDSALYQGPTVQAAILEAIRHRIPLIGFSEGLVRAGALVGFYPDYREVGRQTADAVVRQTRGLPAIAVESPRAVRAAVNERVMRVLGVEYAANASEKLVVVK
jgi:putative ABC transport system substrate-binding protein